MFAIEDYWTTGKRCPKCGSRNFQIVDLCKVEYVYECTDGRIESNGMSDECTTIKRTCYCRECDHEWHPRGDMFNDYTNEIVKK